MQHRIFLVEPRDDLDPVLAQRYWRAHHSAIFSRTPELAGYVQDRPLERYWGAIAHRVCSEAWFADREAERRGFSSTYYRDTVTPDEERFVARDRPWIARVVREEVVRDGPPTRLRALVFGAQPPVADVPGATSFLHLDRPAPLDGPPLVLSVWTDDEAAAASLVEAAGGIAFVTEPAVLVQPATWPWTRA